MGLLRVTPPAVEPLTLAEVRAHLRLDDSNVEPMPVAPLVALASAGAGNVNAGAHQYRITFVTADGETQGGDISESVTTTAPNGKVTVTLPIGGAAVTARKVYRTKAGLNVFYLVATVADNNTTSYTDNIADASLGASPPTQNTTGDPLLARLIRVAREYCEDYTRRSFLTTEWQYDTDYFPCSGTHFLPRPNLIDVLSVTYRDVSNVTRTLAADQYTVKANRLPGRILRGYGVSWPSIIDDSDAVTIRFLAGYGDNASDVPEGIRHAMLLMIGDLYENRETQLVGSAVNMLPAFKALLAMHRVEEFV